MVTEAPGARSRQADIGEDWTDLEAVRGFVRGADLGSLAVLVAGSGVGVKDEEEGDEEAPRDGKRHAAARLVASTAATTGCQRVTPRRPKDVPSDKITTRP